MMEGMTPRDAGAHSTRWSGVRHPLSRFFPPPLPPGVPGDPGVFGPGSAAWRVTRQRVVLAGGPAALLLQVAHPLVAAGVAEHSDFVADPLRRLHGTLDAVLTITFGDTAQVRAAASEVARRHRVVQGTLPAATGPLPSGTPYRAADPDLTLWVLATLVWTSVTVTAGFVRPLPPAARDAYYRDMVRLGRYFGVPAAGLPEDYAALERYVRRQVRDVLAVGPAAALIARQVLRPQPPIVAAPVRPLPTVLAAGLLPPEVREAYSLPWRRRERLAFEAIRRLTRATVPVLPARARDWPHHAVAEQRVRAVTEARPRRRPSAWREGRPPGP